MRWIKSLRIAIRTLKGHRMRTALAVLGVVVGVSSVIAMVSIGEGAQREVLRKLSEMGTDLIVVTSGQIRTIAGRPRQVGNVTTLTMKDADAIAINCQSVKRVAPAQGKKLLVKFEAASTNTVVLGTTEDFFAIRKFEITSGRFFTEDETKASLKVAIVGRTVIKNLFEGMDPIGQTVRISNIPFEIVGVFAEKGTNIAGQDEDDQIIIPVTTAIRRVFNLTYINNIYVQAKGKEVMKKAEGEMRSVLRERHRLDRLSKPDDFTIQTQEAIVATEKETAETFTILLGSIAAISLIVGGVGILAVMLISVRERTREVGIRRAVGAREKDILTQFLMEASLLAVSGGIAGIVIGIAASLIIGEVTFLPIVIPWASVAVSFFFALAIGLFFGTYPAWKASRLNPVEALRYE